MPGSWMSGNETVAGASSADHMCQALEECPLSVSASQSVSSPGARMEVPLGHSAGREHWAGGFSSAMCLRRFLCLSKRVIYTVSSGLRKEADWGRGGGGAVVAWLAWLSGAPEYQSLRFDSQSRACTGWQV